LQLQAQCGLPEGEMSVKTYFLLSIEPLNALVLISATALTLAVEVALPGLELSDRIGEWRRVVAYLACH
jgi:hypothetical protein